MFTEPSAVNSQESLELWELGLGYPVLGNTTNPASLLLFSRYSVLGTRDYFSFGGSVRPKTEIIPVPATFTLASPGTGKYSVLQVSQR